MTISTQWWRIDAGAVDDVPVPADLWSRVQFKVLDHLPVQFTEEETTMIDLETPSHTDEHRKGRSGSWSPGSSPPPPWSRSRSWRSATTTP